MTPKAIKDAIKSRVKIQIADAQSVIVQYDNFAITTPEDTLWIRATILPGNSAQKSIGGATNTTRNLGILLFQIFVPINTGDKAQYDMVQNILTAFKPGTYAGVTYLTADVGRIGEKNSWSQVNVSVPYRADELV